MSLRLARLAIALLALGACAAPRDDRMVAEAREHRGAASSCEEGPREETLREEGPREEAQDAADPASVARGAALFERFECARCHAHEDIAAPPSADCTGCHRAIHDGAFSREGITPEVAARFRAHVRHYLDVPSLDHLDGLVTRVWIARYLAAPHDLRPNLEETMPALPLTEADTLDLSAFLAPSAVASGAALPADDASIARGAAHFDRLGCGSCHALGAREPTAADAPALAPDLAHVRERLVATAIVPFLLEPARWRPGTSMPALVNDPVVARELAAFLVHGRSIPGPHPHPSRGCRCSIAPSPTTSSRSASFDAPAGTVTPTSRSSTATVAPGTRAASASRRARSTSRRTRTCSRARWIARAAAPPSSATCAASRCSCERSWRDTTRSVA